jgi:hypothetical protein
MAQAEQRAPAPDASFDRLATIVHLERRLREAESAAELGFVAVNETLGLVKFRQAFLLYRDGIGQQRLAASGVSSVAADTPFSMWLRSLLKHLGRAGDGKLRVIGRADVPEQLGRDWGGFLDKQLIFLPLKHRGEALGTLAFSVGEAPGQPELRSLELFAEALSFALHGAGRAAPFSKRAVSLIRARSTWALVLGATLLAGFIPIRSSVLAPGEVIARDPAVIRSPLDGIVDAVVVRPNSAVSEGDMLIQLDPRRLESELQAAVGQVAAVEAELRQMEQASVMDPKARLQIPGLQGKLERSRTERQFLRAQAERLQIRSPRDGVVILDNPTEWIGRPVSAGERILQIANPADVELEIRLPAADAIDLELGADVLFFQNIDPTRPAEAALSFAGYRATQGPDGLVAYRLKAGFGKTSEGLRLGVKGTAKVYGRRVTLGYYVLRRPLAALRAYLGL